MYRAADEYVVDGMLTCPFTGGKRFSQAADGDKIVLIDWLIG